MRFSRVLKTAGFAMAIAGVVVPPVVAQELRDRYLEIKKQYEKDHPGTKPVTAAPAQPMQPIQLFPKATRAEPGLIVSGDMATPIDHLLALANDGNRNDEAIAAGEALAADSKATRYDLALVFRTLGYVFLDKGDGARSVGYMQKSVDENALSNNDQYSLMLQVARTQIEIGQPDAGLAMLSRVVTETGQDKPEYEGMRGRIYYTKKDYTDAAQALQKSIDGSESTDPGEQKMLLDSYFKLKWFEQAEKVGESIVHAQPDDKAAILNLAAVYRQDGHADKASALLEDAHKRGLLIAVDDSRTSYVLYSDRK